MFKNRFERLFQKLNIFNFYVLSLNYLYYTKLNLNCLFQYRKTMRNTKIKNYNKKKRNREKQTSQKRLFSFIQQNNNVLMIRTNINLNIFVSCITNVMIYRK